jgi:uncharacterized membrane protein HdeD (DUF308 family)
VREVLSNPPLVNSDELRRHSGWFVALGIVLIILGVIALAYDAFTTIASVLVFGWLLMIGGVIEIVHGFQTHRWGGFFLHLLAGLLFLVAGLLFVANPLAGALSLTLFLGAFFLVGGVFEIIGAVRLRAPHWAWAVLGGLITAVLGLMLWGQWPGSGLWFIGFAVGISMIFRGWAWVMLGIMARGAGGVIGKTQAA